MQTPLNYTGNKSRLIEEFKHYFPQKIGVFVDLFCGGGTVGLSIDAQKVIFIDNNENVIELLKHLTRSRFQTILERLENIIERYGLSYSAKHGYSRYRMGIIKGDNNGLKKANESGFYRLRDSYNSMQDKYSKDALDILYLLVVYGFNNDMRFNKEGEFNLPVGKTDLNNNNLRKLKSYVERTSTIDCEFLCADFREKKVKDILISADFIYADPPYLVGHAVYNENGNWTETDEQDLLNLLEELDREGKKFALSNVLEKVGEENHILKNWRLFRRSDLNIFDIDYHYRSSSYNKKNRNANEREILITNFTYAIN